jgi:hypothetical protein
MMAPTDVIASLETEVANHAYMVVAGVSALCAFTVFVIKLLFVMFERRINEKFAEVEKHNGAQDSRLDSIDGELRRYDKHVAVGKKEMSEIHAAVVRVEDALGSHIAKEEGTTWKKIDDLVDAVNTMRLANEADHGVLKTNQAVLGTRLAAVETKMPNGELKKLAEAYHALAQRDHAIGKRKARR